MPEDALDSICECSHKLRDHRISWFASTGARIVEECDHEDCKKLPWDQTCTIFRKAA